MNVRNYLTLRSALIFVLIAGWLLSCRKTKTLQETDITLTQTRLSDNDVDSITISVSINRPSSVAITTYGTMWSYGDTAPSLSSDHVISVNGDPGNLYQFKIPNLAPGKSVQFESFIKADGKAFYSIVSTYQSPNRGVWMKMKDFPGANRVFPFAFSIGDFGYIGGGFDGSSPLNDFWKYDPNADAWTKMADLPFSGRSACFVFSIGNKGYVGGGTLQNPLSQSGLLLNDFFSFDPQTNTWSKLADFPNDQGGNGIFGTYHFSSNNLGFVGGGAVSNQSAGEVIHKYDPITNMWSSYGTNPTDMGNQFIQILFPSWFIQADTLVVANGLSDYASSAPTDAVYKLNLTNGKWTQ